MIDIREQTISPWPWEHFTEKGFSGWYAVRDSEGRELGSCDGGFRDPDAALIAKAPEMFSLLRKLTIPAEDGNIHRMLCEVMFDAHKLVASLHEAGVVMKEEEQ